MKSRNTTRLYLLSHAGVGRGGRPRGGDVAVALGVRPRVGDVSPGCRLWPPRMAADPGRGSRRLEAGAAVYGVSACFDRLHGVERSLLYLSHAAAREGGDPSESDTGTWNRGG